MLIWKTGGSSTGDRNVMSFHEWSTAERVERHKNILSRVEDPAISISTHKSTYFFRKQHLFYVGHRVYYVALR